MDLDIDDQLLSDIWNCRFEDVESLLEKGADINARDYYNQKWTPLHVTSSFHWDGSPDFVKFLLKNGANIESRDIYGWTPLHVASFSNRLEVMDILLENVANVEAKCEDGWTPLHVASSNNRLEAIDVLLEDGANIESKCNDGCTPLHVASRGNKLKAVNALLEWGPNIDPKDNNDRTPLEMACRLGSSLGIVKLLLEEGASIETRYIEVATKPEVVRLLEDYIFFSTKIQNFFRIIVAKSVSNRLRLEPHNLFEPEFSDRRKTILKIDDSRFS